MNKKLFAHFSLPITIMLFLAVLITLLTGIIARMGDEYKCDHSDFVEQARDARGIPLIYLQRSVQHTYCSPVLMNGNPVPNYGRRTIDTTAIFVDVIFWFVLIVGIRALILKNENNNR